MVYTLIRIIGMPIVKTLFRLKVEGKENLPNPPYIIASNHNDGSDPLFIVAAVRKNVYFLAKKRLFGPPVRARHIIKITKHIPIQTGKGESTKVLTRVKEEYLAKGKLFGIFPEGTTLGGKMILEPKTGVARIALMSKCPVVPMALNGSHGILPVNSKIIRKVPKVKVTIGKPMTFESYYGQEENRPTLKKIAKEIMDEIKRMYDANFEEYDTRSKEKKRKFFAIEREEHHIIEENGDIILRGRA